MTTLESASQCAQDAQSDDPAPAADPAAEGPTELDTLLREMSELVKPELERCTWAEDEIEAAVARHGEGDRGALWNSFALLRPTHQRRWPELVFRAHCRELLDRVVAGADTRPATDAEKFAVLSAASLAAPLNGGATTLYLRLVIRRFPGIFKEDGEVLDMQAYEKVHGSEADDYETLLANKLAQPWRTMSVEAKERSRKPRSSK